MAKGWKKYKEDSWYDRDEFGATVIEVRSCLGWTSAYLARIIGLNKGTLNSVEKGKRPLPEEQRLSLVETLSSAAERRGSAAITRDQFMSLAGLSNTLVSKPKTPRENTVPLISQQEPQTLEVLLKEANSLSSLGRWIEAEQKALHARGLCEQGSEKWAEITLRYCAKPCQQAGRIVEAQRYINSVKASYFDVVSQPTPTVRALFKNVQGWVNDEQYGNFRAAHTLFTESMPLADEAGDYDLQQNNHHFRLRALSQLAMTEARAWLGTSASGSQLRNERIVQLNTCMNEDLPIVFGLDPDNPHHCILKFDVLALVRPGEAPKALDRQLFKKAGCDHVLALTLARLNVSAEDWAGAIGKAEEAYEGYRHVHYPAGIAYAAAIWAYGLLRKNPAGSYKEHQLRLDLWILSILLQQYETHPLRRIALSGLEDSLGRAWRQNPEWVHSYFSNLDFRVDDTEGIFEALRDVYIQPYFPTVPYIRTLLSPELKLRLSNR